MRRIRVEKRIQKKKTISAQPTTIQSTHPHKIQKRIEQITQRVSVCVYCVCIYVIWMMNTKKSPLLIFITLFLMYFHR